MDINFATFRTQVSQEKSAEVAALTFINGVLDRLRAAGTDSNKLAAFITNLSDNKGAFAEAIVANTARERSTLDDAPRDTVHRASVPKQVPPVTDAARTGS